MTDITLVTGASGFLGSLLSRTWVAEGRAVRALVRRADAQVPAGAETAIASDLLDRSAIRAAVQGADTVVHFAGRVHVMRERAADALAAFRQVNVEGTRVLMEEAIREGVRAVVFLSSVKAVGESTVQAWTEETPADPVDAYGVSKLEGEMVIARLAEVGGVSATILRLPLVYGPGMSANFLRLFQLVDRGVPLPLGSVGNARSLVYAGNVIAAIENVLQGDTPGCELYLISDGAPIATPDLIRKIGVALDRPVRLVSVPEGLLRACGRLGDTLRNVLPMPLTTAHVDRLIGSLAVDSSKLATKFPGWPPYTLEQGLKETACWYRALSTP